MEQQQFHQALERIYPPQRLLRRPGELAPYESDGLTAFATRPAAVVLPQSSQEVIETIQLCYAANVPFVARGSGTSLSGGSLPIHDGIVIALNRLDRILHVDPDQRLAVVQPGAVNLQVSHAAAPFGLYYAPDPSSQQVCTIGGNVAFNSGGAHCLKYGMTASHVLAIKAVLADGTVTSFGSSSLDDVGPDCTGFFVGSEGLFGIALEITLRLIPKPQIFHTVLAGYPTLEAAGQAVAKIVSSGLLPGAMEIMDALALKAAQAAVNADYPPGAQAVLIVELEGPQPSVAADRKRLEQLLNHSGASEVRVAKNDLDRAAIWKGRKSAFSAVGRLSPDFIVQDGVVPRSRLPDALRAIEKKSKEHGLAVANVFHAGDGNLHPLILYDGRQPGALQRAEALASEILQLCIDMGGSITGEHGIGMEKRNFVHRMFTDQEVDLMQRLRHAMDPRRIANRGKMFPHITAAPSNSDEHTTVQTKAGDQ